MPLEGTLEQQLRAASDGVAWSAAVCSATPSSFSCPSLAGVSPRLGISSLSHSAPIVTDQPQLISTERRHGSEPICVIQEPDEGFRSMRAALHRHPAAAPPVTGVSSPFWSHHSVSARRMGHVDAVLHSVVSPQHTLQPSSPPSVSQLLQPSHPGYALRGNVLRYKMPQQPHSPQPAGDGPHPLSRVSPPQPSPHFAVVGGSPHSPDSRLSPHGTMPPI